jgi:hypothetical protein
MRPESVILLPPSFDDHLSFSQNMDNLPVEQFISQLSIEGFVVSILPGAVELY